MIDRLRSRISSFERGLTGEQKKMWQILLFLIKFGLASVPIYLIASLDIDLFLLQDIEAKQASAIINSFGYNSSVNYCIMTECSPFPPGMPTIIFQDRAIGIDRACTGYRSFFALIGLIAAVPAVSMRKRAHGAGFALAVIYAANLARLVSTFHLSGIFDFELVHSLMWREGMIAVVFLSWVFWLKKM